MLSTGDTWGKAAEYCKEHYSNCYTCEIRGACWEERRDKNKPRTASEFVKQMCEAIEMILGGDNAK